ncbi:MAG: 50S ribosomal protein L4 [Geobacteraceae bacterium]|nr:50S ribosomal protein L4 [Geobacteraceae bacterium]
MAKVTVYDMQKNPLSEREISDSVFDTPVKGYLIHDVVRSQLAARRQGTAATKSRGMVAGGGKKPYKQKGTGNARQGTIRAPHYVGGGAAFGPSPRQYGFKLNKKVKKSALCSALSARFQGHNVKVLRAEGINVYDVMKYRKLVLTEGAVEVLEGALAQ